MTQKDLFEFSPRATALPVAESAAPKTTFSFLEQARISLRLDQALAAAMAIMVTMAIVYGLGVESGRRMVRRDLSPPKTMEAPASLQAEIKADPAPASEGKPVLETVVVSPIPASRAGTGESEKPKGPYTIQLATYKDETIARKKMQALNGQGLNAFLVPSGSFYQICINGFEKRQQASQSLIRLKSKGVIPKDAYVRMIPTP